MKKIRAYVADKNDGRNFVRTGGDAIGLHCKWFALQFNCMGLADMPLRLPDGSLGDFFDRALLALYAAHCAHLLTGIPGRAWLTGSGLAGVLHGRWSDSRHKSMVQLAESGWIEIDRYKRNATQYSWVYSLTEVAIDEMDQRFEAALKKGLIEHENSTSRHDN